MSESLAIPAVHNNGSSKKELINDLMLAHLSLRESLNKLGKTAPHSRDYYIKQNNDFETAREQFNSRCYKINEVMEELKQIAIAIQTNERQ